LEAIGRDLVPVDDLVGRIWPINERPPESQNPIMVYDFLYAGETIAQKLNRTTNEIRRLGATTTVISALDEVAWLFNLRGSDIPYNPYFKSYAIVHVNYEVNQPELFFNLPQLNSSRYPAGVQVFDYSMFWSHLNATATNPAVTRILANARVSQAILNLIPQDKLLLPLSNSPVQRVKARKNPIERKGMQDCQIRDAVARMKHLGWLEQQLNNGISINETQSSDQLLVYQAEQNYFQFPSFAAISASGDRAAVVHYKAEPATARPITKNQVYLLDVSLIIAFTRDVKGNFS
jgi:Xaa-Pro aminopeptidase